VAIEAGRIVAVGTNEEVIPKIGPTTRVIDLEGKMGLPGFLDAHIHPVSGGIKQSLCNLSDLSTQKELLAVVAGYARDHPDEPWIRGGGWELPLFPQANPQKRLLDEIVPARPVYLTAMDGHSAWVNSKALDLAGIDAKTPDPEDGRIERDPTTGEPTGTLREGAMDLVSRLLPTHTAETYLQGLRRGIAMAHKFGITAWQDAGANEDVLKAYVELERCGELTVRVRAAMPVGSLKDLPLLRERRNGYFRRRLYADSVKIMLDGVIEAKTAALLEPYLGDTVPDRGRPNFEPSDLDPLVAALDREEFQVHIHAIGDRAVRIALDALERAQKSNGVRDSRHHIAHLELIHPLDIPRFGQLGVTANFQPLWAYRDSYIRDLTEPVLGPERSKWLYPIGSVRKAGGRVACGSDWPVTSMNPLEAIQVAVTRRGPEEGPGDPWLPGEVISLEAAIEGYTLHAAHVNFLERETGSIEPGKRADLIVLDRNLFKIPSHQIREAKVLLTFVDGEEVYPTAHADR
jgi:predicted amidohydrolase YtcJ